MLLGAACGPPAKRLTEQAGLAFGKAEEARPRDDSLLRHSSDGLAVGLRDRPAKIADRDLSWPRSDAVMILEFPHHATA